MDVGEINDGTVLTNRAVEGRCRARLQSFHKKLPSYGAKRPSSGAKGERPNLQTLDPKLLEHRKCMSESYTTA